MARSALQQINDELDVYGQTIYFLSFSDGPQKPKEKYSSYQRFLANSTQRLETLEELSDQLRSECLERQEIAKKCLDDGVLTGRKEAKLFTKNIKPVIPRTKSYEKFQNATKIAPKNDKEALKVRRLLASTYNKFAKERGFDFNRRKPDNSFFVKTRS